MRRLEPGEYIALLITLTCILGYYHTDIIQYFQEGWNMKYSEETMYPPHRMSLHFIFGFMPLVIVRLIAVGIETFKRPIS